MGSDLHGGAPAAPSGQDPRRLAERRRQASYRSDPYGSPEPVEVLARVGHHERAGIAVPGGGVDRRRLEITEVDRARQGLRDAGGQRDGDPVALAVDLVPGPGAAKVRGVGEVAPVVVLEAVPLLDEVVAAV